MELEHLLFNLGHALEEAAEPGHDAAFAGMGNVGQGQTQTNGERLWMALNDVTAYCEILAARGHGGLSRAAIDARKAQVEAYLNYPSQQADVVTGLEG